MRAVGNARCTDGQTDSARTMNVRTSSFSILSQLGPDDMWGHHRYYYGSEANTSSSSNRNYYDGDSDAYIAQNTSYLFGWLLWLLAFCGEWHGDTDHAYTHTYTHTHWHTHTHLKHTYHNSQISFIVNRKCSPCVCVCVCRCPVVLQESDHLWTSQEQGAEGHDPVKLHQLTTLHS